MSLMEKGRCMVKSQALLQLEVVMCATYLLNRYPTKALQYITLYEAWHGKNPYISHLRVFGYLDYILMPAQRRRKLYEKVIKCIFVGYGKSVDMGFRLWDPEAKKIICSHDVFLQ